MELRRLKNVNPDSGRGMFMGVEVSSALVKP